MSNITFSHVNIVSSNWKKLAQFYIDVFDCKPVYPERDLSGKWIDSLTKITDAHLKGIHLKLPGYNEGPTLEIFEYNKIEQTESNLINESGFRHIAFHVDDVVQMLQKLIAAGGKPYGELVEKYFEGLGMLRVVYAKDSDGNIIEIQNWDRTESAK